ncbi:MAG TPA: Crp/Fnr family transcriptional regulator [Oscillatoriales cyanobacterium M59_W2019_021]|nr:MAG: Crp/Fnr family transcriptional regulator [Cyanobacteria bacterium J055]HIK32716.1 Crp/Fnr family transcriptional regulator [Oscillatoriales cyanobacterium M4454_W2019_049]HIK50533.1 Crp/Fnr family transcriptional regulator [Oscillatoriales cyanobacterium M59_W2019_021]
MSPQILHCANQLLAALPADEFACLVPHLYRVFLNFGQILYQTNDWMGKAYFPERATISLVSRLSNNSTTEVGLVGNEGAIGLPIILGGYRSMSEAIVQVAGSAIVLDAQILQQEFMRGAALQKQLLLYTQAHLSQISQILACQTHHAIEQRFARWLLSVEDRTYSPALTLTQTSIARMLGVRRASVSEAASTFQRAGLIRCSRGQIVILDRSQLEARSCECYRRIALEFDRLIK